MEGPRGSETEVKNLMVSIVYGASNEKDASKVYWCVISPLFGRIRDNNAWDDDRNPFGGDVSACCPQWRWV